MNEVCKMNRQGVWNKIVTPLGNIVV